MENVNKFFDLDLVEVEENMKKHFNTLCNNSQFKNFVEEFAYPDLHLFVFELEKAFKERTNCLKCKSLKECKNIVNGHMYNVKIEHNRLEEVYLKCDFAKNVEYLDNIILYGKQISNKDFNEIHQDKSRESIIKEFIKILEHKQTKGLYIHGGFGCGKTYIMMNLIHRLAKQGMECSVVFYPSLLNEIKSNFNTNVDILEKIKKSDVLLIDDIGAEKMTEWSRDDVLSVILEYRVENKLLTLFTSNYSLVNLEKHFSKDGEVVKAKRVIDRIQFLTSAYEMVGKNYRK